MELTYNASVTQSPMKAGLTNMKTHSQIFSTHQTTMTSVLNMNGKLFINMSLEVQSHASLWLWTWFSELFLSVWLNGLEKILTQLNWNQSPMVSSLYYSVTQVSWFFLLTPTWVNSMDGSPVSSKTTIMISPPTGTLLLDTHILRLYLSIVSSHSLNSVLLTLNHGYSERWIREKERMNIPPRKLQCNSILTCTLDQNIKSISDTQESSMLPLYAWCTELVFPSSLELLLWPTSSYTHLKDS